MKANIMRLVNQLLDELAYIDDEDFVDQVCAAVAGNERYGEDEIAKADEEE